MKLKVGPHVLILDLSKVTFVSSEAMGRLLGLRRRVASAGGKLLLVNAYAVMSIFEVPGIRQVLNISDGEAEKASPQDGPICRLAAAAEILDGSAATVLENQYERWWQAGRE
jgi:anti-anti-sigma regulatory factor